MEADRYLPAWHRLEPLIRTKLLAIGQQMAEQGGLDPIGEPVQAGDEEFRLDLCLKRGGQLVAALEWTLFDGEVHGGEGFGIGLGLFGPNAEVFGGWYPNRYTDQAFTWDVDQLVALIEDDCSVTGISGAFTSLLRGDAG